MNQMLSKTIKLADQVISSAVLVPFFKEECNEIKFLAQKIAKLLREMLTSKESSISYKRPKKQIVSETEQVLNKALSLVLRCRPDTLMKRVISIIPAAVFKRIFCQLLNSISDLELLVLMFIVPDYEMLYMDSIDCILSAQRSYLSFIENQDRGLDLRSVAFVEFLHEQAHSLLSHDGDLRWIIWFLIAKFYDASQQEHGFFWALLLLFLSEESNQLKKLIINEEGVVPLLKLLQEGRCIKDQEIAAKVIGTLAHDSGSVEHIIDAGVCLVFVKIFKEGCLKVQAEVAWAMSQFIANYPKCQDMFCQSNVIRLLIDYLSFEMVDEDVQNATVINKATSVLAIVMARNHLNMSKAIEEYDDEKQSRSRTYHEQNWEFENPETKNGMKVMAARALWHLAKGNPSVCYSISKSRALMCFVILLDKGTNKDAKYNSAMAMMEITAVAAEDADLRRSAFKLSSPTCKALIEKLVNVVESETDTDLLSPCIMIIGNLVKIFRGTQTRIISSLLVRLDERSPEVQTAALTTLTRFACSDNYLRVDHSKSIICAGGAKYLVHLMSSCEPTIQLLSLHLLCYIAIHVTDANDLVEARVLDVLKWASKQSYLTRDDTLVSLLPKATSILARAMRVQRLLESY